MSFLHRATFFKTAAKLSNLDFPVTGEVAFAGRSNAGKSSAINTLCRQKKLAFTSKTPGRTQQLNYFGLGADRYLVDMPGYGYAKVSATERERWGRFVARYLEVREPLMGLMLIMDSRHPLTELDWQMLDWFAISGRPVHALLTKADKLTKNEAAKTIAHVKSEFAKLDTRLSERYSVSLFSSLNKTGIEEATAIIAGWFDAAPDSTPEEPVAVERPTKAQTRSAAQPTKAKARPAAHRRAAAKTPKRASRS
jgi:GTP-binding protein